MSASIGNMDTLIKLKLPLIKYMYRSSITIAKQLDYMQQQPHLAKQIRWLQYDMLYRYQREFSYLVKNLRLEYNYKSTIATTAPATNDKLNNITNRSESRQLEKPQLLLGLPHILIVEPQSPSHSSNSVPLITFNSSSSVLRALFRVTPPSSEMLSNSIDSAFDFVKLLNRKLPHIGDTAISDRSSWVTYYPIRPSSTQPSSTQSSSAQSSSIPLCKVQVAAHYRHGQRRPVFHHDHTVSTQNSTVNNDGSSIPLPGQRAESDFVFWFDYKVKITNVSDMTLDDPRLSSTTPTATTTPSPTAGIPDSSATTAIKGSSNGVTFRLHSRQWKITDGNGNLEIVDGLGVVGEYPLLRPGETFEYVSHSSIPTPHGFMCGHYSVIILDSVTNHNTSSPIIPNHISSSNSSSSIKELINVKIPSFALIAPSYRASMDSLRADLNLSFGERQ